MLKIGALSYINALPFFCPFNDRRVKFDGQLFFGTPTEINARLENGDVDIGLISSASFIANREKYILLTNLGIGATSRVNSVCLYTKQDFSDLQSVTFAVPHASATSVMLLRVLCQHLWHIDATIVEYPAGKSVSELLQHYDGALVIGDDCLLTKPDPEIFVTDLCSAWHNFTHKPFVFAVFATRLDSWMNLPEEVRDFHQKLFLAYDLSCANFDETLNAAQRQTGLSFDALREYYRCLDYYLDSAHFQGLEQFSQLQFVEKVS